jgi:hypothetical protein
MPPPPPPFVLTFFYIRQGEKGNISLLFAFVFSFFSTPTDISFHLTLAGASWSGALASERQPNSRLRFFLLFCALRSLLCVSICCRSWNPIVIASAPRKEAAVAALLLKL